MPSREMRNFKTGAAGYRPENRDDHLGRLMIIWVGDRFKPLLARRALVVQNEMIIWVCGTVGLWDSCGRLNDPCWRVLKLRIECFFAFTPTGFRSIAQGWLRSSLPWVTAGPCRNCSL